MKNVVSNKSNESTPVSCCSFMAKQYCSKRFFPGYTVNLVYDHNLNMFEAKPELLIICL